MPQIRKLALEEVQALQSKGKGQRKLVEEEYDTMLKQYTIGEYGEAYLEPGENRLTIRNRLRAAMRRRGFDLDFKRTSAELIRFKVIEEARADHSISVALIDVPEVISSDAPPKKRGGRPKAIAAPPALAEEPAPKKRGGRPKKSI